MERNETFKKLLLQFLHTCEACLSACVVEETNLAEDRESFGLMYRGAPDLFEPIHSLKEQYKALPDYVSYTPLYRDKGMNTITIIMKQIDDLPYLKKTWLIQLYFNVLCVAIECNAIDLTSLDTGYIEYMSQFHWKNQRMFYS